MLKGLKVGDELYLVARHRAPQTVKVSKVGRIWFKIDLPGYSRDRFSLESGSLDSHYTQHTRCWKSKEEYDEVNLRGILWSQLTKWFRDRHHAPDKLSKEQMCEIALIVGLELKEEFDGVIRW